MGRTRYGVRDEIKDTADAFYRALSTKNLKAVGAIWAHEPYAAVAGPSGQLHQGWEGVRHFWEQRFAQLGDTTVRVRLTGVVTHAVGDVAWLSGTEQRTMTDDGNIWYDELRVTCVLERKGADWQLVSYHASQSASEAEELGAAS